MNDEEDTAPESLPGWGRLLIVLACAGAVGVLLLAVAIFLGPWIGVFR